MEKIARGSEFNPNVHRDITAVALLSGGLDSTLAAAVVKQAGIALVGLHIQTLFDTDRNRLRHVRAAAEALEIPLRVLDLSEGYLEIVRHPRYGRGAGMNPCIDCRIFMLKAAKRVMEEENAQFVITGEVLGQRPMSQHRRALVLTAEESGLRDRLVRPLSASLLSATLPVEEGWIRLQDLPQIRGRSRQQQVELADRLGIWDYPQPAGGCLLLEKVYTARLRDAFAHIGREAMGRDEFLLLRYGRQFRLSDRVKVIVGRDEQENAILERFAPGRVVMEPIDTVGPLTLVEGSPSQDDLLLSASLAARYCDHEGEGRLQMRINAGGEPYLLTVVPLERDDARLSAWRIDEPKR
jgi:hypothetical protein